MKEQSFEDPHEDNPNGLWLTGIAQSIPLPEGPICLLELTVTVDW